MENMEHILDYFPTNIYGLLKLAFEKKKFLKEDLQEIRVRVGRPIILKCRETDEILDYKLNTNEVTQILEKICENSIYAYQNQIAKGFITIKGGHRIGITGTAVVDNKKTINLKYITSLNFRIAKEVLNCSYKLLEEIIDKKNNTVFNTLIVSPPGKGKTTILRDLIRNISNGVMDFDFKGKTCGVVDERGEIAAMYRGTPQNDIGIRTDVIENISKTEGIKMLIRSMAPEVIACDEIGSKEDVQAIRRSYVFGSKRNFYNAWKKFGRCKKKCRCQFLIEKWKNRKSIFFIIRFSSIMYNI